MPTRATRSGTIWNSPRCRTRCGPRWADAEALTRSACGDAHGFEPAAPDFGHRRGTAFVARDLDNLGIDGDAIALPGDLAEPQRTAADLQHADADFDRRRMEQIVGRSEEHTSEIQSLMRISY